MLLRIARAIKNRLSTLVLNLYKEVYFLVLGPPVVCNICGHKDMEFNSDAWHKFTVCPGCSSQVRHRLLWACLHHNHAKGQAINIEHKKILHFAPEKQLSNLLKTKCGTYHTADYMAEGYSYNHVDFNLDMSDMPSVGDASYDLAIAIDVLEHIPNDQRALAELYRILKPGGSALLMVPQKDHLEVTYEDANIQSSEDRKLHFGQWDHLRIYGNDFMNRLADKGFHVNIVEAQDFPSKLVKKHVLFPPQISTRPLATNFRKLYIATKI